MSLASTLSVAQCGVAVNSLSMASPHITENKPHLKNKLEIL